MIALWIFVGIIILLAICIFAISYYCYRRIFYSPPRKKLNDDEYEIPDGEIYEKYRDKMVEWMRKARQLPHEDCEIKSFDGLTLKGKYYQFKKDAPIEILFHGYRGNSERDLSGGIERCFKLGRNALIVDQRGCGESEGNVITFGINERLDCLNWINFAIEKFGKNSQIILTGISMGASTVMMVADQDLPSNVKYILADCGYSSPKEIIKKVIKDMKLPQNLIYPFVNLGARIFGHFNLEEHSPLKSLQNAKIPVIFIHGEDDDFVPCDMSRQLYDICSSSKCLITIPNAGHGLAYPTNKEKYLQALKDFENTWK